MKVKICGIKTIEDALFCESVGVDYLGFNFFPQSPRFISITECNKITCQLKKSGSKIKLVGVFVNEDIQTIRLVMSTCELDLAQLSGDEPPQALTALGNEGYKALRPQNRNQLNQLINTLPQRTNPPAYLIDAYQKGQFGGTGLNADWSMAAELAAQAPIFLAGGLTPDNVGEAIKQVKPWGVDTASGVESAPGIKDHNKIKAFMNAVKKEDEHE